MEVKNDYTKKVAVGLSGGVDSAVTAYLLREQGHDVTGVYLQCWDSKADYCSAEEDRASAVSVATSLGIKFKYLDFVAEYKDRVINYFYKEYEEGRTPNPDVMCNKEIKFGMFFDWAMANGFDYVATGHYASVQKNNLDTYDLLKGIDAGKDQAYFLYRLTQKNLAHILLPLGDMKKEEVRSIAKKAKLPNYNRPDSQGICFVGEVDIKDFLKKKLPVKTGNVIFISGENIGTHDGAWFYTIGQRHGFKLNKYFGLPLYVINKNVEKNELIVGKYDDTLISEFTVTDVHWINSDPMQKGVFMCDIKIRHLGKSYNAKLSTSDVAGNIRVRLAEGIFGVSPGQSAVFYTQRTVLGGGIIK